MVSFEETKKIMDNRGISISPIQFSFALMVSVGMDPEEAYTITIKEKEFSRVKEDKLDDFLEKCKKESEIFCEENNIKQLINYLKEKYEMQINEHLIDTSGSRQLSMKQLKDISTRLILKYNDNLDNSSTADLLRAMSEYMKNFPPDVEEGEFERHFIQVYPEPFNFVCNECGREGDSPIGVDFRCKHCGKLYKWSEEEKRYY